MKTFIFKLLIVVGTIAAIAAQPIYDYIGGVCAGDIATVPDAEYIRFYTHTPEFDERPVVTDDVTQYAGDSTVLVLGDSFTQLGSRSFVTYLQHYLPGWQVLGLKTMKSDKTFEWRYIHVVNDASGRHAKEFMEMADYVVYLLQNEERLPKTIVLETTETFLIDRMSRVKREIDVNELRDFEDCDDLSFANAQQDKIGGNNDMYSTKNVVKRMTGLVTYAQKWAKMFVGIIHKPIMYEADKDLFTANRCERSIYTISNRPHVIEPSEVEASINNMRWLTELAVSRGVNLIFFVCPEKLTIYKKYALDPALRNSDYVLRDVFKQMENEPNYINNYDLIQSCIDKGTKDMYICNDTHWSYIAADITAQNLGNIISK